MVGKRTFAVGGVGCGGWEDEAAGSYGRPKVDEEIGRGFSWGRRRRASSPEEDLDAVGKGSCVVGEVVGLLERVAKDLAPNDADERDRWIAWRYDLNDGVSERGGLGSTSPPPLPPLPLLSGRLAAFGPTGIVGDKNVGIGLPPSKPSSSCSASYASPEGITTDSLCLLDDPIELLSFDTSSMFDIRFGAAVDGHLSEWIQLILDGLRVRFRSLGSCSRSRR